MNGKSAHGVPLRSSPKFLLSCWWPAAVMLACIAVESTDLLSAAHTGSILFAVLKRIFPGVSPEYLWNVNLALRKIGHVVGYALLSASLFRGFWGMAGEGCARSCQFKLATLAALGTFGVAALDEIHQMYIPSRGGSWHDVALDTAAGVLAQLLIAIWFRLRVVDARSLPIRAEAR